MKFIHDEWCHSVIEGKECSCYVKTLESLLRVARAAKFQADYLGKFMDLYFDDLTPEHINCLGALQDSLYEFLPEVEHLL